METRSASSWEAIERGPNSHLSESFGRRTSAVIADVTTLLLRHEES